MGLVYVLLFTTSMSGYRDRVHKVFVQNDLSRNPKLGMKVPLRTKPFISKVGIRFLYMEALGITVLAVFDPASM